MFGSVNVLDSIDNAAGFVASPFTPTDVLVTLAMNGGMTYFACNSDTFRIAVPGVSDKIEEMVGDKFGWLGDARFLIGAASAGAAHFYQNKIGQGTVRGLHDLAAASLTSLVATEVCRNQAEAGMAEGGSNIHMLGVDDLGLDDDLLGMEDYAEVGTMNFAYGW